MINHVINVQWYFYINSDLIMFDTLTIVFFFLSFFLSFFLFYPFFSFFSSFLCFHLFFISCIWHIYWLFIFLFFHIQINNITSKTSSMLFYFSPEELSTIRAKHNIGHFHQKGQGLSKCSHTWVPNEGMDEEEALLVAASRLRYSDQIPDCLHEMQRFSSKLRNLVFGWDPSNLVRDILTLVKPSTRSGCIYGSWPVKQKYNHLVRTAKNPLPFCSRVRGIFPEYSPPKFPTKDTETSAEWFSFHVEKFLPKKQDLSKSWLHRTKRSRRSVGNPDRLLKELQAKYQNTRQYPNPKKTEWTVPEDSELQVTEAGAGSWPINELQPQTHWTQRADRELWTPANLTTFFVGKAFSKAFSWTGLVSTWGLKVSDILAFFLPDDLKKR